MPLYTSINYPLVRTGSNFITIDNSVSYVMTNGSIQEAANDTLYNQLVGIIYNYTDGTGYLADLQNTIYKYNVLGKDTRKYNHEVYDLFVIIDYLMDFQVYINRFVEDDEITVTNLTTIISDYALVCIRNNIYAKYEDSNIFDQMFALLTIGTAVNQIQIVDSDDGYIQIGSTLVIT